MPFAFYNWVRLRQPSNYNYLVYSGRATGFCKQAQLIELIRTSLGEHFPLDGRTGSKIKPQHTSI